MERQIRLGLTLSSITLIALSCAAVPSSSQSDNPIQVPEYYGIYALASGKLVDVNSDSPTNTNSVATKFGNLQGGLCQAASMARVSTYSTPEMPPDVQFVIYAQSSALLGPMMIAQSLKISIVPFVRNVEVSGCSPSGGPPLRGEESAWDLAFTSGSIDFRVKPVQNHPDMVVAVPSTTLAPGVYSMSSALGSADSLRRPFVFAVSPGSAAAMSRCVDLSVFTLWTLGGVGRQEFKACAGRPTSSASEGSAANAPSTSQPVTQSSSAEWDKALSLGQPVTFTMCRQMSFTTCQRGTLSLSKNEISFTPDDRQRLFAVPPSQVTQVRASDWVRLSTGGKNYNFSFFPSGVTCDTEVYLKCPSEAIPQQRLVATYVAQTIPKLASGVLATSSTQTNTAPSNSAVGQIPSRSEPLSGEDQSASAVLLKKVQSLIAAREKEGNFRSALDDVAFLQRIQEQSDRASVPLWLLFGQAEFETTFGDPCNITTRDGVTFRDGTIGNAHNLFNIRPGSSWTGPVVVSPRDGSFRVYSNYDDCIADYLRLVRTSLYRGKTLEGLVNTYFPANENGPARVQSYLDTLIQFAATLGFAVDRSTVPVP